MAAGVLPTAEPFGVCESRPALRLALFADEAAAALASAGFAGVFVRRPDPRFESLCDEVLGVDSAEVAGVFFRRPG